MLGSSHTDTFTEQVLLYLVICIWMKWMTSHFSAVFPLLNVRGMQTAISDVDIGKAKIGVWSAISIYSAQRKDIEI